MPLLSICIPTHNRSALLAETLSSLCAVKWPFETEVVVSDNASTDETPQILESFPVRSFRQKNKLEAIDNYFAAIRAARGDYAFYLGDDDAVIPDALGRAVAGMQAHPDWVASFSPLLETEQGTDRVLQTVNTVDAPFVLEKGDFAAALRFFMQRPYHAETPLVKAEVFRRFVTRSSRMWYAYWLVGCLLKRGPVGLLGEPVWKHRVRPPSNNPQLQWDYAVDGMDRNRLGLEYIAFLAEKQHGGKLPEDIGPHIVDFFMHRFSEYAEVARNVCQMQGDHQGAVEFSTRLGLWRGDDAAELERSTLDARVQTEIQKRQASSDGPLTIVESADERNALVAKGADATRIVAKEDLKLALALG
jgi:glycosyltransferase involved in cell wall biosynthesis